MGKVDKDVQKNKTVEQNFRTKKLQSIYLMPQSLGYAIHLLVSDHNTNIKKSLVISMQKLGKTRYILF